jgi:glycosyltransferase involved in cell wall biosynthesis
LPNERPSVPRSTLTARDRAKRLAVILSHPIQYYSPWFAHIAANRAIDLRVFYLWDFGVERKHDRGFGINLQWDVPLLEGYEFEFVPNRSGDPGTHRVFGLDNPGIIGRLRAWNPDAILLFGYTYATHLRVMLSPRFRSIPLLLRGDSHDLARISGPRASAARALRKVLFRRFAGFLAVGRANTDYLLASGVPASRIYLAPHCVDNDRFQHAAETADRAAADWKRELGIAPDAPVILFAGKFEEKKRPLDLLEAFETASAELRVHGHPQPALLFVGSGALDSELKARAADRIGRTVFFAPFENQSRMPVIYAAASVFVLPSYGNGETWGLAVNEAMNVGRPVIVSTHVGCAYDLVTPGQTGWVFDAGSVGGLAAALVDALRDPVRTAELGRAARDRVSRYSFAAATSGLLSAVDAVVAKH